MSLWAPAPCLGQFAFDRESVRAQWSALHIADALPCPTRDAPLDGWALFHTGLFERALNAGHALPGADGAALSCRASACHTALVEPNPATRLLQLNQLHMRACTYAALSPRSADAWFWQGWALTQYMHCFGIAPALGQGLAMPAIAALRCALALEPRHAFARLMLGTLQAFVIHAMGSFGALMGYGVRTDNAVERLCSALRIAPASPAVLYEAAQALLLLGEEHAPKAHTLLERAAQHSPRDACQWLWVEKARAAQTPDNTYSR